MTASPFDSAIWRDALFDRETAALFTDTAEVRAIMIVLGTLAKVRGERGEVPDIAAKAIHRASLELQIDPSGLAKGVAIDGDPVAPVIQYFRELMQAPEFEPHVGEGATMAQIEDTAQALRLRQFLTIMSERLGAHDALAPLAARLKVSHIADADLAKGLNLGLADADTDVAFADFADWMVATAQQSAATSPLASALVALITGLNHSLQSARDTDAERLTRRMCLPQMALALGRLNTLAK